MNRADGSIETESLGDAAALVVETEVAPASLRPDDLFDYSGEFVASACFDTLFQADSTPGCPMLGAAEAVRSCRDGRIWEVDLRSDLRWSDGQSLVASDFARAFAPPSSASARSALSWIKEPFLTVRPERIRVGADDMPCSVISERRLCFRFKRPIAYLPALLASASFAPRPATAESDWRVVSGPYEIARVLPKGGGFLLSANRRARRWSAAAPQHVVIITTSGDGAQGVRLFDAGYVDITAPTGMALDTAARCRTRVDCCTSDIAICGQLLPNGVRVPWLRDVRARRAISLAIDRRELSSILNGLASPLWRYTDMWTGVETSVPSRQPDRARRLWRAAAGTERLISVNLQYADFPPNDTAVRAIAESLRDVLHLQVTPNALSYAEYIQAIARQQHELLYSLTPAAYDDPSSMLLPFRSDGFMAASIDFGDAEFDRLLAIAEAEPDATQRLSRYAHANERMLDAMPAIPLLRVRSMFLRKPRVGPVPIARNGTLPFERLRVCQPQSTQ